MDRCAHREQRDHVLREPWQVGAYRLLADGHGPASLAKGLGRLALAFPGDAELEEWLAGLPGEGLAFSGPGRYGGPATTHPAATVPISKGRSEPPRRPGRSEGGRG